ncbi:molecular chaperone [Haloarcula taiwanensis]|uniref:Molecular chaperone n=1 Tax=Haloarcula taiwanensis TaxID=1932004 RepID=A0A2H4ZYN2_9EURY|nr:MULTISPECIES: molecular chaperone TorD family protein [Haloarcula]AUG47591.1 molecular chaperone [Haloarcula taiwanensis]RLM33737.1 molecular chaperone [Haloarcula sp. Atlit-120R]RLM42703.1 molecular chaperone [Haloarcula sp. Atlit-47R]
MASTPADSIDDLDETAAARGAVYATLAKAFEYPEESFHSAAADGTLEADLQACLDRTGLDVTVPSLTTGDDYETLAARYNDIFELGYSEYTDRTDGSLEAEGPPVPLYESKYRPDHSWNDVNLDLSRAYSHYGLEIDQETRDNHDAVTYELEFAGYLARREAAIGDDAASARLDFHDRHLGHAAAGVADRLADEPGTDIYGGFGELLEAFVRADRNDLADRLEGKR